MKARQLFWSFCLLCFASTVQAEDTCKPDRKKINFPCLGCGDLEEQGDHGHDLGWNVFLISNAMQDEMMVHGSTSIVLTFPAYSSPGNLHYTLIIRDPGFTITDQIGHQRAVAILGSVTGTIGITNTAVEGRLEQREEMTQLLSESTTRGTDPYVSTLYDSRGNEISTMTREQGTPTQWLNNLNQGPGGSNHTRPECIADDSRVVGDVGSPGPDGGPLDAPDDSGPTLLGGFGVGPNLYQECWVSQAEDGQGNPIGTPTVVCVLMAY